MGLDEAFPIFRPETARWMGDPNVKCKGLTAFMHPDKPSSDVARAKALCNGLDGRDPCPMRETCLRYAIDETELYGVWGGTSERDRRKIRQARKRTGNLDIYNLEDARFPEVRVIELRPTIPVKRRRAA